MTQLLPGLKRLAFTIPVSMTYLIPEIVTEVSAMLVDRMTFLLPWNRRQREHFQSGQTASSDYSSSGAGACLPAESSSSQMRTPQRQPARPGAASFTLGAGWKTLSCWAGGSDAYRGITTMGPQLSGKCFAMSRHVLARASISSWPVMKTRMSWD